MPRSDPRMEALILSAYGGVRSFKKAKRREMTAALLALDNLSFGVAYTPAGDLVAAARELLRLAQERMSKWWR